MTCVENLYDYFKDFIEDFIKKNGFYNKKVLELVERCNEDKETGYDLELIEKWKKEMKEDWEDYFYNNIVASFAESWLDEYIRNNEYIELIPKKKSSLAKTSSRNNKMKSASMKIAKKLIDLAEE